jgi:hypothetical protein
MVLEASLNTAMGMVFGPTPRTEDAPPVPLSQILPTPGQTPFVLSARVATVAAPDFAGVTATLAAPNITMATVRGSIFCPQPNTRRRSTHSSR